MRRTTCLSFALLLSLLVTAAAQSKLTSPKDHFGFNIGDDYQLVNYTQYEAYLKKLDAESDRMQVREMGKSAGTPGSGRARLEDDVRLRRPCDLGRGVRSLPRGHWAPSPVSTTPTVSNSMTMSRNSV